MGVTFGSVCTVSQTYMFFKLAIVTRRIRDSEESIFEKIEVVAAASAPGTAVSEAVCRVRYWQLDRDVTETCL